MNWFEDLIRTNQQKLHKISASGLINFAFTTFALCMLSQSSYAQSDEQSIFYLDHSLLISRHFSDHSHSGFNVQNASFENALLSDLEADHMEDVDPYYFAFDSNYCHIDPFSSSEDSSKNKQILATCLRNQLWDNENIPFWVRATGVTVLIGAAGGAGKVDDDLKFSLGFDKMDSFFRDWLSNPENQ